MNRLESALPTTESSPPEEDLRLWHVESLERLVRRLEEPPPPPPVPRIRPRPEPFGYD